MVDSPKQDAVIDFTLNPNNVPKGLEQIAAALEAISRKAVTAADKIESVVKATKGSQQQLAAVSTIAKTSAYGLAGFSDKLMTQKERDKQILFSQQIANSELKDQERVRDARIAYAKEVLKYDVRARGDGSAVDSATTLRARRASLRAEAKQEFNEILAFKQKQIAEELRLSKLADDAKTRASLKAVESFENELYKRTLRKHNQEITAIADAEKRKVAIIAAAQREIDLIRSQKGGNLLIPDNFQLGRANSNAFQEVQLNAEKRFTSAQSKIKTDAAERDLETQKKAQEVELASEQKATQRSYNNLVQRLTKQEQTLNTHYTNEQARAAAHARVMSEFSAKGINTANVIPVAQNPRLQAQVDLTRRTPAAPATPKPNATAMGVARQEMYGGLGAQQMRVNTLMGYAGAGAVVGGLQQGISQIIQFEQALKNLQAISGTTNAEMASLGQVVRTVAQDFSFTAVETANAATILAQAGYKGQEIKESLQGVLMLAQATGSQVEMAADTMTTVQAVFQRDASSSMEVANMLTAAVNKTKLGMQQIQLGLQYAGNSAADLNIPLVELVSSFGAATQAGIKSASTIGTGTRKLLEDFAEPNKKYIERLKARGIALEEVDIRTVGLTRTLERLKEGEFSAADAMYAFDVRGQNMYSAITGQMDLFTSLPLEISNTTAALEAQKTQMEGLSASSQNLWTNLTVLFERMAAPSIGVLVQGVQSLASAFKYLSEHSGPLSVGFSVLATVMVARLPVAIAALIGNFVGWTRALAAARAAVLGLGTAVVPVNLGLQLHKAIVVQNTLTTVGFTVAQIQASVATRALGVAMVGARTAGSLLMGIMGGPFGVAIGVAVGAMHLLNLENQKLEDNAARTAETAAKVSSEFEQQGKKAANLTKDVAIYEDRLKATKAETRLTQSEFADLTARYGDLSSANIYAGSTLADTARGLQQLRIDAINAAGSVEDYTKTIIDASNAQIEFNNRLTLGDRVNIAFAGDGNTVPISGGRTARRDYIGSSAQSRLSVNTPNDSEVGRKNQSERDRQNQATAFQDVTSRITSNPNLQRLATQYNRSKTAQEKNSIVAQMTDIVRGVHFENEERKIGSSEEAGTRQARGNFMANYTSVVIPVGASASTPSTSRAQRNRAGVARARVAPARAAFNQAAQGRNAQGQREYNPQQSAARVNSTSEGLKTAAATAITQSRRPEETDAQVAARIAASNQSIDISRTTALAKLAEAQVRIDTAKKNKDEALAKRLANIQRGDIVTALGDQRQANSAQQQEVLGRLDRRSSIPEIEQARKETRALMASDMLLEAEEIRAQYEKRHGGSISASDNELQRSLTALATKHQAEVAKVEKDYEQRIQAEQFKLDKIAADAVLSLEQRKVESLLELGATNLDDLMSLVGESVVIQTQALEKKFRAEQGIAANELLTPEQQASLDESVKGLKQSILDLADKQVAAVNRRIDQGPEAQELARRNASQTGAGANRANSVDRAAYVAAQRVIDKRKIDLEVAERETAVAAYRNQLGYNRRASVTAEGVTGLSASQNILAADERIKAETDLIAATEKLNDALVRRAAITGELTAEQNKLANSYVGQIGGALSQVLEESKIFYTAAQTIGEGVKTMFAGITTGIGDAYYDILSGNKGVIESFSDLATSIGNSLKRMAADILANYTVLKLMDWIFPENASGVRGKIGATIRATPGFPQRGSPNSTPSSTPSSSSGIVAGEHDVINNRLGVGPATMMKDWVSGLFNSVFDQSEGGLFGKVANTIGSFFSQIFNRQGAPSGGGGGFFASIANFAATVFSRAEGGYIPGQKNNLDRVRVRASGGEYMLRSSAVDSLGVDTLNRINKLGAEGLPNIPVAVSVPNSVNEFANARMTQLQNIPRATPTNLEQKIYMVDDRSQIPSLGPNDVVSIVMDSARSRGPILQMVKAISRGGMG